ELELLNRMGLTQSSQDQKTIRRAATEAVDPYQYSSISAVRSLPEAFRQSLSATKSASYSVSQPRSVPQEEYRPPPKTHQTYQTRELPIPSGPPASSRRRSQSWSQVEEPDRTLVGHGAEGPSPTFDPYALAAKDSYPRQGTTRYEPEISPQPAASPTENQHLLHPWALSPDSTVLAHTGVTTKANVGHGSQRLESLDQFMHKSFAPQKVYPGSTPGASDRREQTWESERPKRSLWSRLCCSASGEDGMH
ncbi:hypothetical protein FRC01_010693, partial [Tulasnella sp. 417]